MNNTTANSPVPKVLFTVFNANVLVDEKVKFFPKEVHGVPSVPDYFHRGIILGKNSGKPVIMNQFFYGIEETDRGQYINAAVAIIIKTIGDRKYTHLDVTKTAGNSAVCLEIIPNSKPDETVKHSFSIAQYGKKSIVFRKIEAQKIVKPAEAEVIAAPVVESVPAVETTMAEEKIAIETLLSTTPEVLESVESFPEALPASAPETKPDIEKIFGKSKFVLNTKPGCVVDVPDADNKDLQPVILNIAGNEELFFCYRNGNKIPFLFPNGTESGENIMKAQTLVVKNNKSEETFILFVPYNVAGNAKPHYKVNARVTEIFEKIK